MKTARSRVASERPQLKPEWYSQVPDGELQTPYDVLTHIQFLHNNDLYEYQLAIDTFLTLTESLLERFSPPFRGGYNWDNRLSKEEEWR